MSKAKKLTIGKIAEKANVNIQTLRYYERRNILKPTKREQSGYRLYDEEALARLRFIKFAQNLGFSLRDIKALLTLRTDNESKCRQTKKIAEEKLAEIERKIADLENMRRALKGLIGQCETRNVTDACPILASVKFGEEL